MRCKRCSSHAINHKSHGRDGSDGDLCDVCYWRKRAEQGTTTILELCTLLKTTEAALKAQIEDKRDGPFFHEDEHLKGSCLRNSEEALVAIQKWKEQK